ncbi:MAG: glycosyltransferase family 2 protein [Ruminococcaceae bacterium]|nr:glycosyltransferase family 2 protein [Oscillospiraceae bacterium]
MKREYGKKLLIIIPAYNEAENIERVVDDLIENYPQYDYLVINDGSKDKTADICERRGYRFIDMPINVGLADGVQTGMMYAHRHGYEYALQFDGDGQHDPKYIEKMLARMEHCDICIGSRFVDEKKPRSLRMLGSNIIGFTIRLTTGKRINDPTSGMRMFSRAAIRVMAKQVDYGPEPDTVAHLIRSGAVVEEVQVEMRERIAGESYLNFSRSIKYMLHMCFSIMFIQWCRPKLKLKRRVNL